MIKRVIIVSGALLLAGCAAPKLPLLSDVELADGSAQSSLALPSGDGPAPESLQGELAATEVVLSAENQAELEAQRKSGRGGLFGLFRRQGDPDEITPEVVAVIEPSDAVEGTAETGEIVEISVPQDAQEGGQGTPVVQEEPRPRRKGILGLFGRTQSRADIEDTAVDEAQSVETVVEKPEDAPEELDAAEIEAPVVVASLPPEEPRRGLFGRRGPKASRGNQVTPDEALVFGQVGIACGVRGRKLGKQVDQFKQSGTDFKLYDTNPTSTEPRLHYITGFSDGCPRKFIAALALIGSPQLHERMRYDSFNSGLLYSETDVAYEAIKQRVCGAGRSKPCPENRLPKMEASTAFITYYQRFGDTRNWAEILLHRGKVAASSTRAR